MIWGLCRAGLVCCVSLLFLTACIADDSEEAVADEGSTATILATPTQQPATPDHVIQASPEMAGPQKETAAVERDLLAEYQYVYDEKCIPPNPEDGYTDYDQTVEGLHCAATQLGWPMDRVPSDADLEQLVSVLPEAQNASFERGWAYMLVTGVHSCQWMLTWIDAYVDGDDELREVAEYWLVEVGPDYQDVVPDYPADLLADSRGSRQRLARSVRAGDVNTVRGRTTNCLDFEKEQGYAPKRGVFSPLNRGR